MESGNKRILNIETSTTVCSVSITEGSEVMASRESMVDKSHASLLTVFIDEVMKEMDTGYNHLAAVAVSRGPGSYTGLRIGVSAAKGICYGAEVPLLAVDTLRLMAMMAIGKAGKEGSKSILNGPGKENMLLCPMIDARRMEVYTALYDAAGGRVSETGAHIIDKGWFDGLPEGKTVLFFGNGADKCRDDAKGKNISFLDGIYPSARYMATLSDEALKKGRIENTAYFEPFYLKDFLATTPRNRLL